MKRTLVLSLGIVCAILVTAQKSPYISRVYEYRPAPGQFTNMMPLYEEDDTWRDMCSKAEEAIADHAGGMICLGGWGGYVTFGFDHPVVNLPGEYDLKILGNAMYAAANPHDTAALGGSAEPGIVMVSLDENGNGLPDDPWYELAGSEYHHPLTRHAYSITYYRPAPDHRPTPDRANPTLSDTTYIRWVASDGTSGYIYQNTFHRQPYYPEWIDEDSITFNGTLMRPNAVNEAAASGGSYYVLYCFDWGYVDNHPNQVPDHPERHASEMMIDWAVDADGQPVQLPYIDFVRVYTGLNQQCGQLGETSTEVQDAWDLHPDAEMPSALVPIKQSRPTCKLLQAGRIWIVRGGWRYDILGRLK